MITEKDARAGAARDMGFLAELDFQIRDNHKLTSEVMRLNDENAKLREHIASFIELSQDMVIYAGQNMKRHFAKRLRKLGVPL